MTTSTDSPPPTRRAWEPIDRPTASQTFAVARSEARVREDPATTEPMARVATSSPADVDEAVRRARAATDARAWARQPARRAQVLGDYARALRERTDELGELLTREQGKPLGEARIEVTQAADMVDYYAGLARSVDGHAMTLSPEVHGVVLREPIGVCAVITPWNWPLVLLVRSLAAALAAGNTCVVKPASVTSAVTVDALEPLANHPDMPEGGLTCVLGSGRSAGESLVGHPGVDMIAFTGETTTGTGVMRTAADGLRKVALELGGKSPNLVFADADMDKALEGAVNAIFTTTGGQICTAGSRLVLDEAIAPEFCERLAGAIAGLRVGDGLAEGTALGPMVSADQAKIVSGYIEQGRREGRVVAEGDAPDGPGHFVAPIVFDDLDPGSALVREEIFGPVLVVQRFSSEEEAVRLANDSPYGLASGLWTTDLNRAWRVGDALQAGTVWVNTYHHFYAEAEVGGYKTSGVGRQQGVEGLTEFTQTKHLNFDRSPTLW